METTTDHGPRIDRRVTAIVVGLAVFIALYTGFRVPNAWSTTGFTADSSSARC